jgi:hypothetical protein
MNLTEQTHPYAVRMHLLCGSNVELVLDKDSIRIPFADACALQLTKERGSPREEANFHTRAVIDLDAFPSACEAERAGRLLTASLLWVAAFKRVTIGFRKRTGDYPFAVRNRTLSSGFSMEGEGRALYKVTPEEIAAIAQQAYSAGSDISQAVLISMEFFAAARLEATDRARFISLMTALEALAVQQDLGDEISGVLNALAEQLESAPQLQGPKHERLRTSLSSRLRQLRQESVRQAILRTIREHIQDRKAERFVDDAYGIRSKMLHEGHRVAELHTLEAPLEAILVRLYSSIMRLPLSLSAGPA